MSQMSINSFVTNNTISFWEAVKLKFNDIKNHFLFNYNIFSNQNNLVNISQKLAKEIQIFDVKYLKQEELLNKLKNIPWFSYRENFDQIKDEQNVIYTSDAGWGCMLRSSQMILAQGLCRLNNINNLADFINRFFAYFCSDITAIGCGVGHLHSIFPNFMETVTNGYYKLSWRQRYS